MIGDSHQRYGLVSKAFHWIMAVLVLWQFMKFGDRITDGDHWIGQNMVPWHVSIGTLFLGLVLLRIYWTFLQRHHRPEQNPATALLVRGGHFLLYVSMVLMPVTGVLTMLGGGYGWRFFGHELAARGDKIAWAAELGSLHVPVAWFMAVLVAGHIGIALIHHFIKRDNTLIRMI